MERVLEAPNDRIDSACRGEGKKGGGGGGGGGVVVGTWMITTGFPRCCFFLFFSLPSIESDVAVVSSKHCKCCAAQKYLLERTIRLCSLDVVVVVVVVLLL